MEDEIIQNFIEFYDREYSADVGRLAQKYPKDRKSLVLDYDNIFRFNQDLAYELKENPEPVLRRAEKALVKYDLPIDVDLSDAHVRVKGLDEKTDIRELRSEHVNELVSIDGVVRKVTEVRPKVTEAVFVCQRCGTETVIQQDDHGIEEPYQCSGCERDGPYQIDYSKSELIDQQYLKVQESPEGLRGGETPESVTVPIEDDMTDDLSGGLTAGDEVEATGIYRIDPTSAEGDASTLETYLEGIYVERKDQRFEDMAITEEDKAKIKELSNDPELYSKLVNSIAPSIFGYETEKKAIAFQLFSGVTKHLPDGSRIRGDFHMLLMGDPGTAKSQLIQYVRNIAPRAIYTSGKGSSAAGLTASAVRDDFGDGNQWTLEAGALVLADQGIAAVDELDKMRAEDKSALHEALEQQQVSISKAGINATMKTRCSLLAAANPKHGRFDQYEDTGDQIDLEPALMSRFDLIFIIKDNPDEEDDRQLADHILKSNYAGELYVNKEEHGRSIESDDYDEATQNVEPPIRPELFKKYIAHAKRNCHPTMTDEARDKIEDYYVNLRMKGDDPDAPIPVTARKLEGMVRLAEASARARLSEKAEIHDAERAIGLVNASLEDTAIDPDTGEMDVDIIETGTSKSQRDRINTLKDLVQEMDDEYEEPGVPVDDLKEKTEDEGIDVGNVEHEIQKLVNKGELYEPKNDRVSTI